MVYAVGVDIGGTKVAIGLISEQGKVLKQTIILQSQYKQPDEMKRRIAAEIHKLIREGGVSKEQVLGIGLGAPGPLDTRTGTLLSPPNLPTWSDYPLVEKLRQEIDLSIFLENDASAAALAEKWLGAAKSCTDFIYLTISTGIGAGLFLHNALYTGATGNAGDVGHMVIDPQGGQCVCGQQGCFEWLASGTAIARNGSTLSGRTLSTKEVYDLYVERQPEYTKLIEQAFHYIGLGVTSLINLYDPQMVVIGGGVSKMGEPLFSYVQNYVKRYALNPSGRSTPIVPSSLEQSTGLIGASALVLKQEYVHKREVRKDE